MPNSFSLSDHFTLFWSGSMVTNAKLLQNRLVLFAASRSTDAQDRRVVGLATQ